MPSQQSELVILAEDRYLNDYVAELCSYCHSNNIVHYFATGRVKQGDEHSSSSVLYELKNELRSCKCCVFLIRDANSLVDATLSYMEIIQFLGEKNAVAHIFPYILTTSTETRNFQKTSSAPKVICSLEDFRSVIADDLSFLC
jgi:hypothetical protein